VPLLFNELAKGLETKIKEENFSNVQKKAYLSGLF